MAANIVSLRPARIIGALGALAVLLIMASVASQLALHASANPLSEALSNQFFVDAERNVPTAFSSLLLLLAAVMLALIALLKHQSGEPFAAHWTLLCLGFVVMAVDEAMSYHEKLIGPMRNLLGNQDLGIFYFAWVLPGSLLVLALAVFFARFLWRLPKRTAGLFLLAAALYLGGAIGLELVGGRYAERHGMLNLAYGAIVTLEESLEMAGIIVYLWALLTYLGEQYSEVRLIVRSTAPAALAAAPGSAQDARAQDAVAGDIPAAPRARL